MKINNQVWSVLTIFGKENHRDIFTAHIENFMLGCEHGLESSTLYFNKNVIAKVDFILNDLEYINNWHWSEIEEKNWNKKCKDFFQPVVIDEKIEVIPYWGNARNNYLSIEEQFNASIIYKSLSLIIKCISQGEKKSKTLKKIFVASIKKKPGFTVDYISIACNNSLNELTVWRPNSLISAAVLYKNVRLIDNVVC